MLFYSMACEYVSLFIRCGDGDVLSAARKRTKTTELVCPFSTPSSSARQCNGGEAFSTRFNLTKHLNTIHPGQTPREITAGQTSAVTRVQPSLNVCFLILRIRIAFYSLLLFILCGDGDVLSAIDYSAAARSRRTISFCNSSRCRSDIKDFRSNTPFHKPCWVENP